MQGSDHFPFKQGLQCHVHDIINKHNIHFILLNLIVNENIGEWYIARTKQKMLVGEMIMKYV